MSARLRVAVLAALLFGARAGTARAEPPAAQLEEGRTHYKKGSELFKATDFRAALVEFNRAYALAPSYRIQFAIGQTCAELQDYACATKAFQRCLAEGGTKNQDVRTTSESEIKRLRSLVANVRVVVNLPGAEVSVDDVSVGTSPLAEPVLVSAGRRKISAVKAPLAPITNVVDIAGGDTIDLKLDLVEASGAPPPPSPPASDHPAEGPSRTPFWIGVGATGLLTVATVTFGVLSLKAKSDLDGTVGRFGVAPDDVDRARSKLDTLALVTDLVGGAAIVAAGVTGVLFFTTKPKADAADAANVKSAAQIGVGLHGLRLVQTF